MFNLNLKKSDFQIDPNARQVRVVGDDTQVYLQPSSGAQWVYSVYTSNLISLGTVQNEGYIWDKVKITARGETPKVAPGEIARIPFHTIEGWVKGPSVNTITPLSKSIEKPAPAPAPSNSYVVDNKGQLQSLAASSSSGVSSSSGSTDKFQDFLSDPKVLFGITIAILMILLLFKFRS